jgi:ubiquinone/menaquinone biosynthesis C-methylase UbiE
VDFNQKDGMGEMGALNLQDTGIWLMGLFNRPLVDLGADGNNRLEGIYSPVYDKAEIARFMTPYYDSDAGVESQMCKFDMTGYYEDLLSEALERIGWPKEGRGSMVILELGCGFGSATIPIIKLFPGARLIASDFSLPMLSGLKHVLAKRGCEDRCTLLQLNAEDLDFKPGTFDFVVGAAILHHLLRPEALLERSFRVLKPGGCAIFYEPFESGTGILTLIYRSILRHPKAKGLKRKHRRYFKACIDVWQKNKNTDKNDPYFQEVDDKWVFTRHFLETHARKAGFDQCIIYPLEKSNRPFASLIHTHLDGNGIKDPPAWIQEIIDEYELTFSDDAKKDLLTEGCIILRRGGGSMSGTT